MKIALIYLNCFNLGDMVIYETARHIIEGVLENMYSQKSEIVPVDIGTRSYRSDSGVRKKDYLAVRLFRGAVRRVARHSKHPEKYVNILRKCWRTTGIYTHYLRNEKGKLEGADCVIFAGGGLVKFHRQNFHYFIDDITAFADEHGIPVLMNAAGVEGYNQNDADCMVLKEALNRGCVRHISTRDDIDTLKNCYIINPNITVSRVCDPALWACETYNLSRREAQNNSSPGRKIGLNIIRPGIFGEYMYDLDSQALADLYRDLAVLITDRGFKVEFFSNGLDTDESFARRILKNYPELKSERGVTVMYPRNPSELVSTLLSYDRFLSARLHSAILGTVFGVPNASLVWNNKQLMFGSFTGTSGNFIVKDNFRAEHIFDVLMSAKSVEIDPEYKMSVVSDLETQIRALALKG